MCHMVLTRVNSVYQPKNTNTRLCLFITALNCLQSACKRFHMKVLQLVIKSVCVCVYQVVRRQGPACLCHLSCSGWPLLTPVGGDEELQPAIRVNAHANRNDIFKEKSGTLTVFGIWSTYCGFTMARRSSSRILVK